MKNTIKMKRVISAIRVIGILLVVLIFQTGCITSAIRVSRVVSSLRDSGIAHGYTIRNLTDTRAPVEEQSILLNLATNYRIARINGANVPIESQRLHFITHNFIVLPPGEYTIGLSYYEALDVAEANFGRAHRVLSGEGNASIVMEPGKIYVLTGFVESESNYSEFYLRYSIRDLADIDVVNIHPAVSQTLRSRGEVRSLSPEAIISGIDRYFERNSLNRLDSIRLSN